MNRMGFMTRKDKATSVHRFRKMDRPWSSDDAVNFP